MTLKEAAKRAGVKRLEQLDAQLFGTLAILVEGQKHQTRLLEEIRGEVAELRSHVESQAARLTRAERFTNRAGGGRGGPGVGLRP